MSILKNALTGATLAHRVERAVTPWRRSLGFLFVRHIEADRGLWFAHCGSIHTIGMFSALDVIFLDQFGCVIALRAHVRPNRPLITARGARTVIEMGPGFLRRHGVAIGEQLELRETA